MSEFEKELEKFNLENGTDYRTISQYSDVIATHFNDWRPSEQNLEVPWFVADFIKNKKGDLKLYGAFHEIYKNMYDTDLYWWVSANNDRQEAFAKAWIDGYAVEKERQAR